MEHSLHYLIRDKKLKDVDVDTKQQRPSTVECQPAQYSTGLWPISAHVQEFEVQSTAE